MYRLMNSKAKELLRRIRPKFPIKQMEEDYQRLRESMLRDFKAFTIFLIILNAVGGIFAAVRNSSIELYFSTGTLIALLLVICVQRRFNKYTHVITLVASLSYNIVRLVIIYFLISKQTKARVYFAGYSLASLQGILLLRLVKTSHKLYAVLIALVLRFVYLNVVIEPGSFDISIFIRNIIIDIFVVYTIYSQDITFRKVYQEFVQKKDELLKFKELLADYLPQSLIVVNSEANTTLFYNKAFQKTFTNETGNPESFSFAKTVKPLLSSLVVETSTIRETGNSNSTLTFLDRSQSFMTFEEILKTFQSDNCFHIKTISLAASHTQEEKRKLFEITIQKVKWDSEDTIAIMFNDITYQESLIALKLANTNKDKVIATVSHELRTPLNGIIGIMDIAEKKTVNPEVAQYLSLCKDNAHLLLSLVNSILDLQQISVCKLKLNPANVDIRKAVKSISQLFVFQCKQKSIYLETDIQKDVPTIISSDENRLKQILINLVGNAIKFTQKGGIKIEVNPHPTISSSLQISVSDTGIGIRREDYKHLFKMYSKIEDGESVNKNGVGLGLTISNALAMLLSGPEKNLGLNVESEYGKGTKFFFNIQTNLDDLIRTQMQHKSGSSQRKMTLALTEPEEDTTKHLLIKKTETDGEQKTSEDDEEHFQDHQHNDCDEFFMPDELQSKLISYASFGRVNTVSTPDKLNKNFLSAPQLKQISPKRKVLKPVNLEPKTQIENSRSHQHVLIVDDNPFNLLVARNLLQELGCSSTTSLGGSEAIQIIRNSVSEGLLFKAIFMDCQMPFMDGFEATRILLRMMKEKEIPTVPIYGWTANNSEEDVKRCYEAGMTGYLPKPASKEDVLNVISKLC